MLKRRWMTLISLVVAISFVLSGCGGGSEGSSEDGGKVTITLGGAFSSPAEKKIVQEQVAAFEKENPNIKVKLHSITGDYLSEMQTLIAAKDEPDVYYLDSMPAPQFMKLGVLEPLDEYIKKNNVDLSAYEESLVKAFQWEGKTYGIPKDYNTLVLFYNKKMFEEAGVKPPKTWDELRDAAKKFSKGNKKGLALHPSLDRYQPFLVQNGGQVLDDKGNPTLNHPANVEALQFITDLFIKDKVADTPSNLGVEWNGDAFAEEKVAMVFEGGWMIPFLKEKAPDLDYGMVELPVKEKENSNLAFTVAYVMSKNSEHKEEAFKLLQFLTSEKGQQYVVEGGLALPSLKSMGEKFIEKFPEREPFVKAVAYAEPYQYGEKGNELVDTFNKAAESAILKKKPAKEALEEAQNKLK
ncbi:carbohydrate ABC transporter substrate-binding protein (CUT1 family) [Planifilum fimeticola]|uniref:Carbohydrate ABC transporter substrate-binding protein (CUT1 family) n=1 Tax=Planifilum fimeticola TaxID=201975 RepID=A0A2T0LAJ0_9BACL|nr:ABC transporter substrate-binding protein [Planifilum fimeticola]PRX38783.1 carbohydrate ABC transporter substrate-binding protein (CUT1 family) [Planifilum fimeticola]